MQPYRITKVEDYKHLVGAETIERIKEKARPLRDVHVVNINSTFYGGGVSQLLSSLTLLMNSLEIKTGWRAVHGPPDFFSITKKIHNALQGKDINLSHRKMDIYQDVIYENVIRSHIDHDFVIIHDPQPLAMISHYRKKGPWIWRCHIDLSSPNKELWDYMAPFVEKYDAVILSCEEYKQNLKTPQVIFMPAIDPFSITNQELSQDEVDERLRHYNIPTDLPLIVQISRFDRWKDPEGVIQAFNLARKEVDCTLVLLGNVATDDPEGEEVYRS
ncbi:MAG: glycosyl transferase family 1, partial [Chloroflexota bacterium]|nr:glycosyl transferase family 1 [Chloroflexota bacterium]